MDAVHTSCWFFTATGGLLIAVAMIVDERPEFGVSAVPDAIRFGPLSQNGEYQYNGKLRNVGRSEVLVRKVWSSCGCIQARTLQQEIGTGQEIDVIMNLKAGIFEEASVTRYIYVEVRSNQADVTEIVAIPVEYSVTRSRHPRNTESASRAYSAF